LNASFFYFLAAIVIVILAHVLDLAADDRTNGGAFQRALHRTTTATSDRPDTRRNHRACRTAAKASNQAAENTTNGTTDSGAFCGFTRRINPS
jgi:hypothetical protein